MEAEGKGLPKRRPPDMSSYRKYGYKDNVAKMICENRCGVDRTEDQASLTAQDLATYIEWRSGAFSDFLSLLLLDLSSASKKRTPKI